MPEIDFVDGDITFEHGDIDWEMGAFTLEGAITPAGDPSRNVIQVRASEGQL